MASKSKRNRQRRKRKEALLAAPDVAVTVAVAAPDKEKKMGGGMMVPPEREEMAEGGDVDKYELLREQGFDIPVNLEEGTEIFFGPSGSGEFYLKPPVKRRPERPEEFDREYMAPSRAAPTPKQRLDRDFFKMAPPWEEDAARSRSKSIRERFNKAFAEARKARKDTFMFDGERYTTDIPVDRKTAKKETAKLTRSKKAEGGEVPVDTYPNIPPEQMAAVEASQLPDEQMEDGYIDYVLNEALQPEEQTYLMNALENDPQLSMIFDKVIGTASEFTGSGEVTGPGTGVSDSIPARLSDGEFVMTRKATDQIGADRLQRMMDEAERAYDGGLMRKDEDTDLEDNMNKVMLSANQMPSLNVRQR